MKTSIDFDGISNEIQNRIDFVVEQASKNPEVDIRSYIKVAKISKMVCMYALELYTDELREIFLDFSKSPKK